MARMIPMAILTLFFCLLGVSAARAATYSATSWVQGAYGTGNVLAADTDVADGANYVEFSTATLVRETWGAQVTSHKTALRSGTKVYQLPYSSTAKTYGTAGSTSNYVLKLDFENIASVNGRSLDGTIYITSVSFSGLYTKASTGNGSYATTYTTFASLTTSMFNWGVEFGHDSTYRYNGQITVNTTIELSWSDTGEDASDLGAFVVASDIDIVDTWANGSAYESITFGTAFDELFVYATSKLKTDGAKKFYPAAREDVDQPESTTLYGVYGVTDMASSTLTWTGGVCYTELRMYVPDVNLELQKTVAASSYTVGDTVVWTVSFTMPSFYTEILETYDVLTATDTLPNQVAFESVAVNLGSSTLARGTHYTVTAPETETGGVLVVAFTSTFLDNKENYAGKEVTLTITTKAAAAGSAANEVALETDAGSYDASARTTIYEPQLSIEKTVDAACHRTGDDMTWTVTVSAVSGTYNCAVENVTISDELPAGLVLEDVPTLATTGAVTGAAVTQGDAGGSSWTVEATEMAPGSTITVTFHTAAPAVDDETTYVNAATAAGDGTDAVEAEATARVLAPGSLTVQKETVDETEASVSRAATFTFTLEVENAEGSYEALFTAADGSTETGSVTFTDGAASLALAAGEQATVAGLPGGATYKVTEAASDCYQLSETSGASGEIPAGGTATALFVNAYTASGAAAIEATKTVANAGVAGTPEGLFTFQLIDGDGNVVASGTNAADGSVELSTPVYHEEDDGATFTYTLCELDGGISWYAYDDTVYIVEVRVNDVEGTGALVVDVSYCDTDGNEVEAPTFTNSYLASGAVELTAFKAMEGAELSAYDGAFTFTLTDALTDEVVSTAVNQGGVVTFEALSYDASDIGETYTYVVAEVAGDVEHVVYSSEAITYTVKVSDAGRGVLEFDTATDGAPVFTNALEDGALTVAKEVSESSQDDGSNALFTFFVQLTGTGLDDGTYDITYTTLAEALASAQ